MVKILTSNNNFFKYCKMNPYEQTRKSIIYVSSNNNKSVTSSQNNSGYFICRLPAPIQPIKMKLLSFSCPNTVTLIGPELGKTLPIPILENGTTSINVPIPYGCYNVYTLATAMAAAMTSESASNGLGYTYTCTADIVNFKFTWTSTGPFQFEWSKLDVTQLNYSLFYTLGFMLSAFNTLIDFPVTSLTTVTSNSFYNLSNPSPLFITLHTFPASITSSSGLLSNYCITNTTLNGDILTWDANSGYEQYIYCPNQPAVTDIGVSITDENGRLVPFHVPSTRLLIEIEESIIRR